VITYGVPRLRHVAVPEIWSERSSIGLSKLCAPAVVTAVVAGMLTE
jgi:hypothetical protein